MNLLKFNLLLSIILISVALLGCTSMNLQNGKNCQMDERCFIQALEDKCQNVYMNLKGNGDYNGVVISRSTAQKNTYCEVTHKTTGNGEQIQGFIHNLAIPIQKCNSNLFGWYINTNGKCVNIDLPLDVDSNVNP